ncbi:MAG: hypothetical protein KME13_24175 [Myxacorys californica WJT36-NPBG1]|jgi:hypothetical protein|nr:hypothetical protein [Myxacorys californica WJT36-NPBG1]
MPQGFIKQVGSRKTLAYPAIDEIAGLSDALEDAQSAESDAAILIGQPLYLKLNGHLALAQANSQATSRLCGLAIADAGATFSTRYVSSDVVERADWTPITGAPSLSVGSFYYLSPDIAGHLTTIAPTETGLLVVPVGMAISAQKLSIDPYSSTLL